MTFANVSVDSERLSSLSQLLLTAFPGSTIHQSRDPVRAAQRLSTEKIDVVFADVDIYSDIMHVLQKQKSNASVYLLCRQGLLPPEGAGGIRGVLTYPITKQKIQLALKTNPQELREVI